MTNNNQLNLFSWNVNGIRAVEKKGFTDIIKNLNPDIIGIQETKAQPDQIPESIINMESYKNYWFSAVKKGYSGVGVLTRIEPLNVINGIGIEQFDIEGRVITLEFDDFYFINCYYPNAQHELLRIDYKTGFNTAILEYCEKLKKKKTIVICGDYNVAHKEIDLKNPRTNMNNPGFSIQERDSMDTFINTGYIDTFRMFNNEPNNYTWWSYRFNARKRNIGWRIDYFCVDESSVTRILDAEIHPSVLGSDHCPVSMKLKV